VNPLPLYKVLAYVTGIVLAAMTVVGLPLKYLVDGTPAGILDVISYGWIAHGWLFMAYVVVTLWLGYIRRWPLLKMALVCIAGTIPFAVFFAERRVVRDEAARSAGLVQAEPEQAGPAQA
jgi:integral membrane protein